LAALLSGAFHSAAAQTEAWINISPPGAPAYFYHNVGEQFLFEAETDADEGDIWWTATPAGGHMSPVSGDKVSTLTVTNGITKNICSRLYRDKLPPVFG